MPAHRTSPACLSAGEVRALLQEIGSAMMTCARSASLVSDDGRGLKLKSGGIERRRLVLRSSAMTGVD
jgi:hypothetical protein